MKGKLCAAIVAEDSAKMIETAEAALAEGADLVEFRLDHLRRVESGMVRQLRKFSSRCIITVREKSQGGAFTGTEEERIGLLRSFSSINPLYLDIELDAARKDPAVAKELRGKVRNLIVSQHYFDSTPDPATLAGIYKEASEMGTIAKIVSMAKSAQDNLNVMALYEEVKERGSLVAFTMGELGVLTRILCLYSGSPFSFVSFGERASAPGQIPLKMMRKLMAQSK